MEKNKCLFGHSNIYIFPKDWWMDEWYESFFLPKHTQLSNCPNVIPICSESSLTFFHALICLIKPHVHRTLHSWLQVCIQEYKQIHTNTHWHTRIQMKDVFRDCLTVPEKFAQTSQTKYLLNLENIKFVCFPHGHLFSSWDLFLFLSLRMYIIAFPP